MSFIIEKMGWGKRRFYYHMMRQVPTSVRPTQLIFYSVKAVTQNAFVPL